MNVSKLRTTKITKSSFNPPTEVNSHCALTAYSILKAQGKDK